jgi:GNAT superfamily N-acetyltransferase
MRAMAASDPELAVESSLSLSELPDAEALVQEAGWNQVAADWRAFLDLGTVYAVRTGAGRVIATAATLPHGGRFAWISMVLVAGEFRRRGLATRLMRRCMDDLDAARLTPVLDATPAGRAVYRALGFEDTWGYQRLALGRRNDAGVPSATAGGAAIIRPITDADWCALCAYDAAAFGADRSPLLARLRGRVPAAELIAERNGRVVGFLLGRDGRAATQLGPLIAEDDAAACGLLAHSLDAIAGSVYLDVADVKTPVHRWLAARGFAVQRPFTRMIHHRRTRFDDAVRTFVVMGPEFG